MTYDRWPVMKVRWGLAGAAFVLVLMVVSAARAQSWTGNRTTPALTEIVAIDATGEDGWPYGSEDVEGDGEGTFRAQEQSLDIRTAYATADSQDFWVRVYVSDVNNVGGNIRVFVFVDSDQDPSTGGSAAATEVDPALDSDPSPGGYEWIIEIRGNGTMAFLWQWDEASGMFQAVATTAAEIAAEAGADVDPIMVGATTHGYLQATVALSALGLTEDCAANLFVRSINDAASTTASDLNVGNAASCVPADQDSDGVPDLIDVGGCASNADCAGGGICVNGQCVFAVPCTSDADCNADEVCSADNLCVAAPTGATCSTNDDCGDLVCENGQCVACSDNASCGTDRSCGPDGRCVTGTSMPGTGGAAGTGGTAGAAGDEPLVDEEAGEEAQGGACTCGVPGGTGGGTLRITLLGLGLALWAARRRRGRRRVSN